MKNQTIISLCHYCFAMTKKINGKCGKCGIRTLSREDVKKAIKAGKEYELYKLKKVGF